MASIDRSQFPKSPSSESMADRAIDMGVKIAQATLGSIGLAPSKGASLAPGIENLAKLIKTQMAESKEVKEKSEKLNISPEEYSARKDFRDLQEQIKEVQELQKKAGYEFTFGKEFSKTLEESSKNVKEGFEEVASAISDQPKKQIEELRKAGFGKKEEAGAAEALFGGLRIPEARQQAIQLALGATGLGGVEEVFGVSERVEKLISQTKEKREKAKTEEETAQKLGVTAEEYRGAQEASRIKKERRALHEEALSLGLRGFSDVAAEIEEEKAKKAAEKTAGKPGAALSEETFADFVAGVKEGVTEGLKEAGIVSEDQAETIAEIADNTQKTHEKVSELHETLKGEEKKTEAKEKKEKKVKEDKDKEKEKKEEGQGLIRSILSGAISALGSALTSPTGWLVLGGIGAIVGGYFGYKALKGKEPPKSSAEAKPGPAGAPEMPGMEDALRRMKEDQAKAEGSIPKDFPKAKKEAMASVNRMKEGTTPATEVTEVPFSEYHPTPGGGQERLMRARGAAKAEGISVSSIPPMATPPLGGKPSGEQKAPTVINNIQNTTNMPLQRNPDVNSLANVHNIMSH